MPIPTVRLKPGHVQPVWAGHPWVYAQAVERIEGGATRGDEVEVRDPRGNFLGRGFYSPGSAIVVRILARDETTPLDGQLFRERFEEAARLRAELGLGEASDGPSAIRGRSLGHGARPSLLLTATRDAPTTGYRLVHAEGDGVPGLVVDRFGDVLAVQFLTAGMKQRERLLLDTLEKTFAPRAIVDRTPEKVAKIEAFKAGSGVIRGDESTRALSFHEHGFEWEVPLDLGQKTGFYFDQRELRARVAELSKGRRVLDAYAYIGAFGIGCARDGAAEVVCVDESANAIEVGAEHARRAGLADRVRFQRGDAREAMRSAKGSFDLTIVDPPRLAPKRSAREAALVEYTKLAELGCRATRPGGLVVFCSCSAAVDLAALTRALATGALRANVQARVFERWFQGPDHPVSAAFGEGLYLKALVARVVHR